MLNLGVKLANGVTDVAVNYIVSQDSLEDRFTQLELQVYDNTKRIGFLEGAFKTWMAKPCLQPVFFSF